MKCMYCGHTESRVVDSRPTDEGSAIRRRRECEKCGRRFTTYEKVDSVTLLVIKKDKRREPFDAEKIRRGLVKACEKRPVPLAEIDRLVREIETTAYNSLEQEIATTQIGEMVMDGLKRLDEVSYIRFASVHRQFRDIQSFMQELNELLLENAAAK
ncbi:MAG: transcriptional regulator NrdR [Oscillospiraceae bacterium]|nr:transcriptional regulator NrdR [Oscillospiraceae bacterium]